MVAALQVININDFTGGLNLRRDAFLLRMNESPDMLNMDVDPRGGFRMRNGTTAFNSSPTSDPIVSLSSYSTTTGIQQIIAAYGTHVGWTNDGNFVNMPGLTMSAAKEISTVTFKDNLYVFNGKDIPWRWNGSTATQLTDASVASGGTANWNDDLQHPQDNGRAVIANLSAVYQGSVWVAGTTENGTYFPNRLRFSHPNHPEDWRSFDYIDIDTGNDGDVITAMVPFMDRLLIFKHNSIYALYGFDANTFKVLPISHSQGAVSQKAVVPTDMGVFFFSWPRGVFMYNGKQVEWLFEKLYPAISEDLIPDAYQSSITMGWHIRRLWVSVPWGSGPVNQKTFVADPTVKGVPWVQYSLQCGVHLEWEPPGGTALSLAALGQFVCLLEQQKPTDNFGGTEQAITSYYVTGWEDLKSPAYIKQWKRPEFVVAGGIDSNLMVSVYKDYDPSVAVKTFLLTTKADPDAGVWNTDDWNYDPLYPAESLFPADTQEDGAPVVWARSSNIYDEIVRGASLGTSRAVRLRIDGPSIPAQWGIDGFSLKFIPKRLRP